MHRILSTVALQCPLPNGIIYQHEKWREIECSYGVYICHFFFVPQPLDTAQCTRVQPPHGSFMGQASVPERGCYVPEWVGHKIWIDRTLRGRLFPVFSFFYLKTFDSIVRDLSWEILEKLWNEHLFRNFKRSKHTYRRPLPKKHHTLKSDNTILSRASKAFLAPWPDYGAHKTQKKQSQKWKM